MCLVSLGRIWRPLNLTYYCFYWLVSAFSRGVGVSSFSLHYRWTILSNRGLGLSYICFFLGGGVL